MITKNDILEVRNLSGAQQKKQHEYKHFLILTIIEFKTIIQNKSCKKHLCLTNVQLDTKNG